MSNIGGQREFLRLFLTSVLFVFVHAVILKQHSGFHSNSSSPFLWLFGNSSGKVSRRTRILVTIVAISVVVYHFAFAPFRLHSNFVGQVGFSDNQWFNDVFSARAYFIPYLVYLPFSIIQFWVAAWLFIGLGLFYFIKRLRQRNTEIVSIFKKELTLCYDEAILRNWADVAKRVEKTRHEFQDRTQIASQLRHFLDFQTSKLFLLPLVLAFLVWLVGTELQKTGSDSSPLREGINRMAPPGIDFLVLEVFDVLEFRTGEPQSIPYKCKLCFVNKPPLAEVAHWAHDANISTVWK